MRVLTFLLAFVLSSAAWGQIDVAPSMEPYRVFPVTIATPVPDGATFDGGWKVDEGVSYLEHDASTIHLTATPGTHTIGYSGFWVHVVPVTFKDGDGNEITIQSYLGSGIVNESAVFTVVGGADPVLPQPPGPATGPKHLVFFVEADNLDQMPPAQRYLVNSLQARQNLLAKGHRLILVMDDDQLESPTTGKWKPWIDSVRGDKLPRVGIAPAEGGDVLDYPLPVDWKHLMELLGETP